MSYASVIAADAKAGIQAAGDAITVTQPDGTQISTYGVPRNGNVGPRDTDERRTNADDLVIAIPKSDVPTLVENGTRVTFPARWLQPAADATATLDRRIAALEGDKAAPGEWLAIIH